MGAMSALKTTKHCWEKLNNMPHSWLEDSILLSIHPKLTHRCNATQWKLKPSVLVSSENWQAESKIYTEM